MSKTILVIGSVTAKQYSTARLAVLRQGDKPKIVHVTVDDLRVDEFDLHRMYGGMNENEVVDLDEGEGDRLLKEYILQHYSQYGDIASIVVSDEVYDRYCNYGSFNARWYADGFFDNIPTWHVHATGYVELIS